MSEMTPHFKDERVHSVVASFVDPAGSIYVASRESGDILKVSPDGDRAEEPFELFLNTGGVPNGVALDPDGVVYICDFAHQAVLTLGSDDGGDKLTALVNSYEGNNLKGPNSVVVDSKGTVYFTDSGPLGTTTLQSPKGSVFCISRDGRLLQPLAHQCLAHPSGLAVSADERILYVCETMANRVLRFVQRPVGVYHFSVFHQFSGGLCPSGVALDKAGNLYVSQGDFSGVEGVQGMVTVLSPQGKVLRETVCPGADVTGVVVAGDTVYVSESTTDTLFSMPVLTASS